ncbi:hypothetical protein C8J57DRAFT_1508429 [Mycena rebaudengoi]|nr:hypothetical protein C8J57DRAFT_1508429 [Mycena rebaudengoi]
MPLVEHTDPVRRCSRAPERAPPPCKRTRRSIGCGVQTWTARAGGVITGVVPLEAQYFTTSRRQLHIEKRCG